MGIRKVRYRSYYGEELIFDNRTLFCEEMHIGNAPAKYNGQARAFCDGQYSGDYLVQPLPLNFKFALRDVADDAFLRRKVQDVFTSVRPGVITITEGAEKYTIEAHLTARPDFVRISKRVWRWDAAFIADFPYFKKGVAMKEKELTIGGKEMTIGGEKSIVSRSPVDVPVIVAINATGAIVVGNSTTDQYIYMAIPSNAVLPVTIDTENFRIKNGTGVNVNQYLSGNREIGDFVLAPGNNTVYASLYGSGSDGTVTIKHWELRGGVI